MSKRTTQKQQSRKRLAAKYFVGDRTRTPWAECFGRGSGQRLDGLHKAITDMPYGKMRTFCGVVVSAVYPTWNWMWRRGELCRPCRKEEERLAAMHPPHVVAYAGGYGQLGEEETEATE